MYDNPFTAPYPFANMDFGGSSGATTHSICGPAGMRGKLKDIAVVITEATVFASTLGHVQVGTAADPDAYGKLNIPTASADGAVVNSAVDTDAIIDPDIPANTEIVVTLTEGTGASLAGQGVPLVFIDWY
jgi:hypothetical protein